MGYTVMGGEGGGRVPVLRERDRERERESEREREREREIPFNISEPYFNRN